MAKQKVAKVSEIPEGGMKEYQIGGKSIALARVGGEIFAFDNICTHAACPLSGSPLEGYIVTCWCHGSKFDIRTGEVKALPAVVPLATFKVEIRGEDVFVEA